MSGGKYLGNGKWGIMKQIIQLTRASHYTFILAAAFTFTGANQATAQANCIAGLNPGACIVRDGNTVPGTVSTIGPTNTVEIENAGAVQVNVQTTGNNSGITNSGTIIQDAVTNGAGSSITNTATGAIGRFAQTFGDNSEITNAGIIDNDVRTQGTNSGVNNSGTIMGSFTQTDGAGSGITNSGVMGDATTTGNNSAIDNTSIIAGFARTEGDNSDITNSGTISLIADTSGADSDIINTGIIINAAVTSGVGSDINNSGLMQSDARTFGNNSNLINSGMILATARTVGDNSSITNTAAGTIGTALTSGAGSFIENSGVILANAQISGVGSSIENIGVIQGNASANGANGTITNSGRIGGGVFMNGLNPTLTLQRGSVIEGQVAFGPLGISTLNVERGMNLRYFLINGQPDVLNTPSFSFQSGNALLVVDPTGFAASDVMIGDLTSAIFDAVDTRGGSGGENSGGRVSTQGAGGHTKVWASLIGGFGTVAGHGALTDIDTQFYGLIAGVDIGQVGAFAGTSTSSADSEFNTQDVDMDSIFAGVNWRPQLGRFEFDLALAGGTANHDQTTRFANNLAPGGVEQAAAKFDGWFVAPSVKVSTPFSLVSRPVVGSVRVNYTALFLDGYTETGVIAPLTVPSRTTQQVGAHADLAFPIIRQHANGAQSRFEIRTGLDGQINFGSSGRVPGLPGSFDANADDRFSGVLGGSYGWTSASGRSTLTATTEAQLSARGGYKLSAGLKASWTF